MVKSVVVDRHLLTLDGLQSSMSLLRQSVMANLIRKSYVLQHSTTANAWTGFFLVGSKFGETT